MFEGYHTGGGWGDADRGTQPWRIDDSMTAAHNSLRRAYALYGHYQQNPLPSDRDTLKNKILTEVTFARTFYLKVQRDFHDHPLAMAAYRPRMVDLEHQINGLIDTLRSDGIVYEDLLLNSKGVYDQAFRFPY